MAPKGSRVTRHVVQIDVEVNVRPASLVIAIAAIGLSACGSFTADDVTTTSAPAPSPTSASRTTVAATAPPTTRVAPTTRPPPSTTSTTHVPRRKPVQCVAAPCP